MPIPCKGGGHSEPLHQSASGPLLPKLFLKHSLPHSHREHREPRLLLESSGDRRGTGVRGSSAGVNTHLELPYHRAIQLGLFLVEFKGLAEILQAFKGGHSLQLTIIHLQEGVWGPGQRGAQAWAQPEGGASLTSGG